MHGGKYQDVSTSAGGCSHRKLKSLAGVELGSWGGVIKLCGATGD
jgi:hypothetical protein